MSTSGYNLLLQMDEKLINKALAAVFYTGRIKYSGSYSFVDGIPEELTGFTSLDYTVRLKNEPTIDFSDKDKLFLRLSVELFLCVLSGIEFEFDVEFRAQAEVLLDSYAGALLYSFSKTEISSILINDKIKVSKKATASLNEIISIVLKNYLTNDLKEIRIPFPVLKISLPGLPEGDSFKLPVALPSVKIINNRLLAIGVNFFDNTGGTLESISDLTDGKELYVSISECFLKSLVSFWWENTDVKLKKEFSGEFPVSIKDKLGKGIDILTRAVTLGFIETESEVLDAVFKYNGCVSMTECPEFDFIQPGSDRQGSTQQGSTQQGSTQPGSTQPGSDRQGSTQQGSIIIKVARFNVNLNTFIDAQVKKNISLDTSSFLPDSITPWNDNKLINTSEKRRKLFPFNLEITIDIQDTEAKIYVNSENRICINMEKADINLDFGSNWLQTFSEKLANKLMNLIEDKIIKNLPDIPLTESLLPNSTEIFDYTFEVKPAYVGSDGDSIYISADTSIKELSGGAIRFPLYIASQKSKKLHRFDCEAVDDIAFEYRKCYHIYGEAISDGMKPCRMCLQ